MALSTYQKKSHETHKDAQEINAALDQVQSGNSDFDAYLTSLGPLAQFSGDDIKEIGMRQGFRGGHDDEF
jgi:hypothetical protein